MGTQSFCAYKQVDSTYSYRLSSINFTSSQFAPTSVFASTSVTAKVRRPPGPGGHKKYYNRVDSRI